MRKFLVALSFFTRIKINLKDVTEDEFFSSMTMMPLVGVVIGLWMYLFAWAAHYFHLPTVGAFIVIFAYFIITGGLHLDGLSDTVDGIMSARDQKRVLEIMKDSRLGAMGAIALIMLFLGNYAGFQSVLTVFPPMVLLLPVVGRFCGIQNCFFGTYAEGGGGLGKRITELIEPLHLIVYLMLIIAVALLFIGWAALIAAGCAMISAGIMLRVFNKKIGGMTGDTIGMTVEVSQTVYLLASAVIVQLFPMLTGGYFTIC